VEQFMQELQKKQTSDSSAKQKGNLVQFADTWRIHRPGDDVPESAKFSDCSVEPSKDKFTPCGDGDGVPARVLQLSIETMLEELAPNLWEHSLERLVDFGHSVGQDLEMAALGTEHELMHGESVAVDMALMTVLSQHLGLMTTSERDRTLNMLRRCRLPVWSPLFSYELFAEATANRVKNSMGQKFPLAIGIGKAKIVNDVSDEDLRAAYLLWQDLCAPHTSQAEAGLAERLEELELESYAARSNGVQR
jgi:hypothetical protein